MKNIKNILEKIFQEDWFEKRKIFFYKDWGYFAIHFCEWQEIKNFFNDQRVSDIISLRDEMTLNDRDILKNLSLIISLKIDNINNFEDYKNDILKVEEDEYFFRKYVLVYDEVGGNEFFKRFTSNKILDELNNFLWKMDFDEFRKNKYNSSFNWLIIQLFIKLPFLRINNIHNETLQNLTETINKFLEEKKLKQLDDFVLNSEKWSLKEYNILDIENLEIENFFNNLSEKLWK